MKDRKHSISAVAAPCVCEPVRTSRRWREGPASGHHVTGTHRADAIEQTRRWRGDDIKRTPRTNDRVGAAKREPRRGRIIRYFVDDHGRAGALHDVVDAVLPRVAPAAVQPGHAPAPAVELQVHNLGTRRYFSPDLVRGRADARLHEDVRPAHNCQSFLAGALAEDGAEVVAGT